MHPPRPILLTLWDMIQSNVQQMLQLGVIEGSCSPWRNAPMLVLKPDGSVRFCIDFRCFNEVSTFDAYPMPQMDNMLDLVGGATYLSTTDLTKDTGKSR